MQLSSIVQWDSLHELVLCLQADCLMDDISAGCVAYSEIRACWSELLDCASNDEGWFDFLHKALDDVCHRNQLSKKATFPYLCYWSSNPITQSCKDHPSCSPLPVILQKLCLEVFIQRQKWSIFHHSQKTCADKLKSYSRGYVCISRYNINKNNGRILLSV